jgi:CheY-like chemotaxis protein
MKKKHIRILIVDDSSDDRFLLRRILQKDGYKRENIFEVEDGSEVLDFISKNHIDVIMSDTNMPKLPGPDACREVRKKFGDSIVIIGLSDSSNPHLKDEWLDCGANAFFQKAVSKNEISDTITLIDNLFKKTLD